MKNNLSTINARKFDGTLHRTWKANLIQEKDSLLLFVGVFEKEIEHRDLGVIRRGTISYEYYWLDRWYNLFRFHEPNGDLRNYYFNINMPPIFENKVLDYVDLDIDIVVWKDFTFEVLDKDEFAENSLKYNYSEELTSKVFSNLNELERLIKLRKFPFDEIATK